MLLRLKCPHRPPYSRDAKCAPLHCWSLLLQAQNACRRPAGQQFGATVLGLYVHVGVVSLGNYAKRDTNECWWSRPIFHNPWTVLGWEQWHSVCYPARVCFMNFHIFVFISLAEKFHVLTYLKVRRHCGSSTSWSPTITKVRRRSKVGNYIEFFIYRMPYSSYWSIKLTTPKSSTPSSWVISKDLILRVIVDAAWIFYFANFPFTDLDCTKWNVYLRTWRCVQFALMFSWALMSCMY